MMRTMLTVGLAVWAALTSMARDPAFDLGDTHEGAQTSSGRVLTVASVDDLALQGLTGPGAREVATIVGQVLKENPGATRLRVLCGTATEGSVRWTFVYPRSVTPLDSENRPHGIEWLAAQLSANPSVSDDLGNYRLVSWKNGVRDGLEREFKDGKLATEVPWQGGKMHGARKAFFPDGKQKNETLYVDGLAEGPSRIWDENGKLRSECQMKAGKRHGTLTEYWPGTDQPQRVVNCKNDRIDGAMREFYSNGKLKRERHFLNEVAHGEDRIFDESGKLATLRFWFDGDPVSKEEFETRAKATKK